MRILKNNSKEALLGRIFDLGVREGHTILIWGYAEGYNFDLGVRGYQKVENPCSILSSILSSPIPFEWLTLLKRLSVFLRVGKLVLV
jgi:hypothetical protein